jgi:LysM repeat protein
MKTIRSTLLALLLTLILAGRVAADTTYTVVRGDTLSAIARRFGVTVPALAEANHLVNPNLIYVGQTLVVPGVAAPGANPSPPSPPPPAGAAYVVRPGDTLYRIAIAHGVTIAALVQANNLSNPNLLFVGQVLLLPGAAVPPDPPTGAPTQPTPTLIPAPIPPPPPSAVNLLPNPSFEAGSYNLNGIPELQVPHGWLMEVDDGQAAPGTGQILLRPESRVLPRWNLPAHEQPLFIYHGDWTIKVFKGGAPMSFRLFTDLFLEPGTYRLSVNFYPDLVAGYTSGGQKIWAAGPSAGEVAFIWGGPGSWSPVVPGIKNSLDQTFSLASPGAIRLGLAFRTRYILPNNGFFVDDWSLQRLGG